MSLLNAEDARTLAARVATIVSADEAEVVVVSKESALTRFADNRIHQNVSECDTQISIRAVLGAQTGSAATNRLDEDALRACATAAVDAARVSPADPDFRGLPAQTDLRHRVGAMRTPETFGAEQRADTVRSVVEQSRIRGLHAAGGVSSSVETVAVSNSHGVDAGMTVMSVRATVLSSGDGAGTGWASYFGSSSSGLDAIALGDEAATLALRTSSPQDLAPGDYTVVLAPEAVADIVDFLGYMGFSARAVAEGRSFMSGRIGERIVSDAITISDDAFDAHSCGLTFDFEGQPKTTVPLIDSGIAIGPVTDSYWAARTNTVNTGHALPAPNAIGPLPLDLAMAPGDATLDALIASVQRGVYVTRFHYVNVEDPIPVTLTGMTRDGTFLIENGTLTSPLKNLRFTQSAIEALGTVHGVTAQRRPFQTMLGCAIVPGLLLGRWTFTGQTE